MRGNGILIGDDYDLKVEVVKNTQGNIVSGLIIGKTILQNQALIIFCRPGEIKENPRFGCGIEDILLDNDLLKWRRQIRLQLEMDKQLVKSLTFSNDFKLRIDAEYNS